MVQSSQLKVSWAACGNDGHWCDFLLVKLDSDWLSKGGVYVIWSENADGSGKTAAYAGQGKPIADCLARHRDEVKITRHGGNDRVLRATNGRSALGRRAGSGTAPSKDSAIGAQQAPTAPGACSPCVTAP